MMTQPKRVYEWMLANGPITCKIANDKLGVSRLPAIISVLKKQGVEFNESIKTGLNRFGEKTWWKEWEIDG